MKKDNNRDNNSGNNSNVQDRLKNSVNDISSFYQNNKTLINGIGIAALAGVAIFSVVKWLPYEEIVSKIEEKFDEKFADKEFSTSQREYANS